jgi:hypothetical protein
MNSILFALALMQASPAPLAPIPLAVEHQSRVSDLVAQIDTLMAILNERIAAAAAAQKVPIGYQFNLKTRQWEVIPADKGKE